MTPLIRFFFLWLALFAERTTIMMLHKLIFILIQQTQEKFSSRKMVFGLGLCVIQRRICCFACLRVTVAEQRKTIIITFHSLKTCGSVFNANWLSIKRPKSPHTRTWWKWKMLRSKPSSPFTAPSYILFVDFQFAISIHFNKLFHLTSSSFWAQFFSIFLPRLLQIASSFYLYNHFLLH